MTENAEYTYFDTVYFDIIQFLEEYEKLPCLWDRNHSRFRDKNARVKAEESLGEKLGIADLKTLRRKIRSVRGTYNAEIRKIKLSLDDNEVHIPKLSWFSLADDFLRVTTDLPVDFHVPQDDTEISYTPRHKTIQKLPRKAGVTFVMVRAAEEHTKNWENDEIRIESLEDNAFDEEELEFTDEGNPRKQSCDSLSSSVKFDTYDEDTSELLGRRPSDHSDSPELLPSTRKKHKSTPDRFVDTPLADVMKTLKDIQKASENEFAAFGRSVAVQLQSLPIEIAAQLQTDIQAHITRMRLDYLKKKV